PSSAAASATIFASIDGVGTNTGIAIANVGVSSNNVTLTLYDQAGSVVGTSLVSLGSRSQIARFIDQLPGFERITVPFEGTIAISSLQFFSAVGLLLTGPQLSTLPTLPGRSPSRTSNNVTV